MKTQPDKREWKERLNYIKDPEGNFTAYPVNIHGVTVSAKSLDTLKTKAKKMCKSMLGFLNETIDQDDPFELKEYDNLEEWLYNDAKHELSKLKHQLQRYKDVFGDLPSSND